MAGAESMSDVQLTPILIVEDDLFIAEDIKAALEESEYRNVEIVRTFDEALHRSRSMRPVLALIDVQLPGARDGIELATELLQQMGTRTIFVTAHSDAATAARAKRANPVSWLKKPFGRGTIRAAVA